MPSLVARGPSYTEFKTTVRYNEDDDGALSTNIELATTDDSDQLENKYIETAGNTIYIPLDHYTTVNKVVIQNRNNGPLWFDYVDAITTDVIIGEIGLEDGLISFCVPDTTAGIFLFDLIGLFGVAIHITIYGEY